MPPITRRTFLETSAVAAASLYAPQLRAQSVPARVTTPSGTLLGETISGVNIFKGIPFAAPPIGDLRFRPPQSLSPWRGDRPAIRFAPNAMQSSKDPDMSEDCLYLNLYAPATPAPAPGSYPVLVWVHGGSNTGGSSREVDGSVFARAGIIVVSVAYRLGVFGFLDLEPLLGPAYAGSANNALKDVVASLAWVQRNIAAFGGDPHRVTLAGQSAGSRIVAQIIGAPSAQPCFSSAICQSGGAERLASRADSAIVTKGFAATWQRSPESLKTAPAADLIAAQSAFNRTWPQRVPLRPEIDGHFFPHHPVQTIAASTARGKRLLIGTNLDESASFITPHPVHDPVPSDIGTLAFDRFQSVLARYRKVYPDMSGEHLRIRAVTAEEFWVPAVRVAGAFATGGGRTWMYQLRFVPSSGNMQGLASHGEEMAMIWQTSYPKVENAPAEAILGTQVHAAWVAFLKGDAPHAESLPPWPEYHPTDRSTMIFNTESKVELRPLDAELRLWDGVI